jgi:predicted Zn-dependent protease
MLSANMLSAKKAAEIGKEMYEQITSEMVVYEAAELNDYLTGIGQRIVRHSDQPNDKYTFTIIDNPEINAFATPGGYIYVNRGLLIYMNSEAQLAAVLAHEIAHITAQHAARQKRAQTGSNVVAGVFAVLTGSADVGEATALWGAAAVKGYGRDMELEADAIGAKYLVRAGYPSDAMIEIISQLKDHERFMKKRAKESGKKVQSYHGLFSSHPRNDQRLREMVKQSAGDSSFGDNGVVAFRIATEGLPWGNNYQSPQQKKQNRYYDSRLTYTFDYPDGWKFDQRGQQVTGQPENQSASLTLTTMPRTLDSPDQFIKNTLNIPFIRKSEPIVVAGLKGHSGIIPGKKGDPDTRLAILYFGHRVVVFWGNAPQKGLDEQLDSDTYDQTFKNIIGSFQPLTSRGRSNKQAVIHYVKARSGATYAKLAGQLNLGRYGAEELRLINGHYPSLEPKAKHWIKIIR